MRAIVLASGLTLLAFSLGGCRAIIGVEELSPGLDAGTAGAAGGGGASLDGGIDAADVSVGGNAGAAGGGSAGVGGEGGSSGGNAGVGGEGGSSGGSAGVGGQGGAAGSAGQAGAAGAGGTAGQGGAAGAGGQGGSAGAAGSAGQGGSSGAGGQGGAAGSAGQAGAAGAGGTAGQGGAAGAGGQGGSGGSGGSAGQGGSAGAGGSGGGCTDGVYRCFGSELQKCASNAWTKESTCSAGTPVCSSSQGKCLVCLPNTAQCDGATLEVCNSNGSAFASTENCGSPWKCDATTKSCLGATTGNVAEIALHECGGCARLTDGHVKCWGNNYAHVVDPKFQYTDFPVHWSASTTIADLADVRGIAAGPQHACAIVGDSGTVQCWGSNKSEKLGKIVDVQSLVGVPEGLQGIVQLSLGDYVSCARNSKGDGWCWGDNRYCGSGTATGSTPTPQKLPVTGIVDISAGRDNVCAVTDDGNLYCWNKDHLTPYHVGINKHCDDVEVTYPRTTELYVRVGSSVWRTNDAYAANLQLSSVDDVQAPVSFQALGAGLCWTTQLGGGKCQDQQFNSSQIQQVLGYQSSSQLGSFGCARTTENTVVCWGSNKCGQIGNNMPLVVPTPASVANLSQVSQLLSFFGNSDRGSYLAVLNDGSYLAWGLNSALWPDILRFRSTPTPVLLLGDKNTFVNGTPDRIYTGRSNGMAFFDYNGQHDDIRLANTSGETYKSAFPSYHYDIGQIPDGTVVVYCPELSYCNKYGILGNGTTDAPTLARHTVPGTQGAVGLYADDNMACVWFSDGSAKCWGSNGYGATGTGSSEQYVLTPTSLVLPNSTIKVKKIVLGCALAESGSVYCWGDNQLGQLGRGTMGGFFPSGDLVLNLSGAIDVSSAENSRCAVLSTGHVKCWGHNYFGQLGLGDYKTRSTPTEVPGIADAIAIASTGNSFCALRQNGGVSCWGGGLYGELGNNKVIYDTPQLVQGL